LKKQEDYNMIDELIDSIGKEIKRIYGDNGATVSNIVSYALQEGIIHPTGIRDYNIKNQFKHMQATTDLSNTKIIYKLAYEHNLSDTHIFYIVEPVKK